MNSTAAAQIDRHTERGADQMDGPQDDLIEQIMRASLEKQSALRDKAPAGDGPPDAPDLEDGPPDTPAPEEAPPKAKEQPPPNPEQSQTEQSQTEQPKAEPPKAGKALVGLTAALAVAAAVLLIVCLVQFQAYKNAVSGLRETMADIQSIDEFRTENQQLRQELDELQKELAETQSELRITKNLINASNQQASERESQSSGLWACLVAREIYAAGDHEGSAAALKVLLNNIEHVENMQSFIRGKEYRLWEMMANLVAELQDEGYLSQEEADSLNNKFKDIDIIPLEEIKYG